MQFLLVILLALGVMIGVLVILVSACLSKYKWDRCRDCNVFFRGQERCLVDPGEGYVWSICPYCQEKRAKGEQNYLKSLKK